MVYESWLLLNLDMKWKQREIHTPEQLKSHTSMTDSSLQQKRTDNPNQSLGDKADLCVRHENRREKENNTHQSLLILQRALICSVHSHDCSSHTLTHLQTHSHTHGGEIKNNRSRSTHIQTHKRERGNGASCASVRQRAALAYWHGAWLTSVFYVWKKFVFSWTRGGAYREKLRPRRARPAPTNILSSLHSARSKHKTIGFTENKIG